MYISIDIGGTTTRIASARTLVHTKILDRVEFKNSHDFEADFSRIVDEIKKFSSKTKGIGIGFAGDLNKKGTLVLDANNNTEWEGKPFMKRLLKEFNCQVTADNDAAVAALGVAYFEGYGNRDFTYITWGTGIGGALVKWNKDKAVVSKLNWYDYFEDWESKCGGRKIESRFGKSAVNLSQEEWLVVMKDLSENLRDFIEKTSPKIIVFGGGITQKQIQRLKGAVKHVSKETGVEIDISKLGEDTVLYGGFALTKNSSRN